MWTRDRMPVFPVPDGRPAGRLAASRVDAGLRRRFPAGPPDGTPQRAATNRRHRSKGFPSYFLIVADLISARSAGIRVGPGRGSAAGSLVAYALGITDIIDCGLLFERFLNPERTSMPDIIRRPAPR